MIPSIELVRMVNSGTEATMSALRLARGYTSRSKMIKFTGCYHGHGDSFLIAAGSGAITLGEPNSPGVTRGTAADTLLAQFNDIESVAALFDQYPDRIAGVIVEPVNGNVGCIPPQDDFLSKLRQLCTENNALLILDEIMTGFRVSRGGANELYAVDADLLTFGKVIGGGFPIGAYAGKKEFMEQVAPSGPIYQAGTLSGNPVAVAAGIETLKLLTPESYQRLETLAARLENGIQSIIDQHGLAITQRRVGSMFALFFRLEPIKNIAEVNACDFDAFNQYFHYLLNAGVYIASSQYEAGFISLAHDESLIDETVSKIDQAVDFLK